MTFYQLQECLATRGWSAREWKLQEVSVACRRVLSSVCLLRLLSMMKDSKMANIQTGLRTGYPLYNWLHEAVHPQERDVAKWNMKVYCSVCKARCPAPDQSKRYRRRFPVGFLNFWFFDQNCFTQFWVSEWCICFILHLMFGESTNYVADFLHLSCTLLSRASSYCYQLVQSWLPGKETFSHPCKTRWSCTLAVKWVWRPADYAEAVNSS